MDSNFNLFSSFRFDSCGEIFELSRTSQSGKRDMTSEFSYAGEKRHDSGSFLCVRGET
jgi:hypothetical protein